jgi:hypothetical protein
MLRPRDCWLIVEVDTWLNVRAGGRERCTGDPSGKTDSRGNVDEIGLEE